MAIKVGDRMPKGTLQRAGTSAGGGKPEEVEADALFAGRRVVLFGVPGAFTGTCSTAHLPSFMRTKPQLDAKGVDEVACLAGNDASVMRAWGESSGATAVGIAMLSDPSGAYIQALGLAIAPPAPGVMTRTKRFAALIEDGVVRLLHEEPSPGACEVSSGEAMLAAM